MPYGMQVPDDYDIPYTSTWTRDQYADEAPLRNLNANTKCSKHDARDTCPDCRKEKTA